MNTVLVLELHNSALDLFCHILKSSVELWRLYVDCWPTMFIIVFLRTV